MDVSSACQTPGLVVPVQINIFLQPVWLQIHLRQHQIIPGIFPRRLTPGQGSGLTFLSSRLCRCPGGWMFSLGRAGDKLRPALGVWRWSNLRAGLRWCPSRSLISWTLPQHFSLPGQGPSLSENLPTQFSNAIPSPWSLSLLSVCPTCVNLPPKIQETHLHFFELPKPYPLGSLTYFIPQTPAAGWQSQRWKNGVSKF